MLELDQQITINDKVVSSPNLCDQFSYNDLCKIGNWVADNYQRDLQSRETWARRSEAALDLAMQVQKAKTFPWPGCSNIAFPLVTIAALQFHARAYPAIVNGRSVVDCRVVGPDPQGVAHKRAELISTHMSWQLLEQDEGWEEGQDRALLNVAIVGVGWKKTLFDASRGYPVSEFVPAKDLVVNYWAKSIESATVKTHVIPMWRNTIHERVRRGSFADCLSDAWYQGAARPETDNQTNAADNRSGVTRPGDSDHDTPFIILEQHCWMDLDKDGYAEPYIVTFEEQSHTVLRIVTRFDRMEDVEFNNAGQIVKIDAIEYFTKIPFVPSPDGGIMDVGFGTLLGPLNESVNSSLNQLFDAGTLSNTAGGFLGRGAKIRGGVYQFQPFSWNRVDATGDDLRKSIFPLPVREPSAVMFNLLSLLIDYTNRVSGSTDMMVGENPGQNTPAETSRAMIEQGQKIYSAIFKRIWRSMKAEFKKLYTLNSIYLPSRSTFGEGTEIRREDYLAGSISVIPTADPTISSDGARFAQARMLREAAATNPGYDADAVEKVYLKALGFDNIEVLYPGQANMPPPAPDVKIQIQEMKGQIEAAKLEQSKMEFIMTMQEMVRVNSAKITELTAKAALMEAQATSMPAKQNVEAFRAGIEALRLQNEQANNQLDRMMETRNAAVGQGTIGTGTAGLGLAETPNNPEALSLPQGPTGSL